MSIKTTDQLREDADAARRYAAADHGRDRPAPRRGSRVRPDPVRRLRRPLLASPPARTAELGNLTRFLTYHEHHGIRSEARRQYAAMSPEARDWTGADLEAARAACPNKLDFAKLLPECDRHLA